MAMRNSCAVLCLPRTFQGILQSPCFENVQHSDAQV